MRGSPLRLAMLFFMVWAGLLPVLWRVTGQSVTRTVTRSEAEQPTEAAWLQVAFTEAPEWVRLSDSQGEVLWEAAPPELDDEVLLESIVPDARGIVLALEARWPRERRQATVFVLELIDSGRQLEKTVWSESDRVEQRVVLQ